MEFEIKNKKNEIYKVLIDNKNWDRVKRHKWHLIPRRDKTGKFYIATYNRKNKSKPYTIYLHRFILNVNSKKKEVDHKDNDTFNNYESNLRISDRQKNSFNQMVHRKNNVSGYKGVSWKNDKWLAQIMINKKGIRLGRFKDKIEAAIAYNQAAIKHFGDFACLNIIESR